MSKSGHRQGLRIAGVIAALVLIASAFPAAAQSADTDDDEADDPPAVVTPAEPDDPMASPDFSLLARENSDVTVPANTRPLGLAGKAKDGATSLNDRTDHKDGSASLTFGTPLPAGPDTKVGVDLAMPAPATPAIDPDALMQGRPSAGSGAGWVKTALPGAPTPLGWDKTALSAKVDAGADKGNVGAVLSRSLPLNEKFSLTLENSYAVTGSLASPTPGVTVATPSAPLRTWETTREMKFNVLPTDTTLAAGAKLSSTDERWLRSLSAEQKIVGPLSVAGGVSETAGGDIDKSVKAKFKTTW